MQPLLNHAAIRDALIQKDPWAGGHGVIAQRGFLGSALLYFSLVYMLPAKTAVVLGSGSGFVPRVVRQAQREVLDEEFFKTSRCLLVDACKGAGKGDYHDDPSHFFRASYPEIDVWKMTTDDAAVKLKEEGASIDYLHIDADHTFEQSLKDFENYLPLMAPEFVITLHDTADDGIAVTQDGCVPRTIAHLRREMQDGGKYEHLEMVNFNNRYRREENHFQGHLGCRGVAVVKPKTPSLWDCALTESIWF